MSLVWLSQPIWLKAGGQQAVA